MTNPSAPDKETIHYFVDEAGTPTLFAKRREVIVGNEGCSKYFLLGKAAVDNPEQLSEDLESLRCDLLADPYFKNVPSMQEPHRGKTAIAFHAKDDRPEARYEVYKLLLRKDVSFFALVRDKNKVVEEVHSRNRADNSYWYKLRLVCHETIPKQLVEPNGQNHSTPCRSQPMVAVRVRRKQCRGKQPAFRAILFWYRFALPLPCLIPPKPAETCHEVQELAKGGFWA